MCKITGCLRKFYHIIKVQKIIQSLDENQMNYLRMPESTWTTQFETRYQSLATTFSWENTSKKKYHINSSKELASLFQSENSKGTENTLSLNSFGYTDRHLLSRTSFLMNLLAKPTGVDTFADYTKAQLQNIMKTIDPNQQQQQALTSSVNTSSWMKACKTKRC